MFIQEFIQKYNLHNSLLENMEIDKAGNIVRLTIDYCYWQQSGYCEGERETGIVHILFSGISNIIYDNHILNSDEIVSCKCQQENIFVLTVESDITKRYHTIEITANSVKMTN